MSSKKYYAVGLNREHRNPAWTTNPDCHFDPSRVPGEDGEDGDMGEWVVAAPMKTKMEAMVMAAMGQRSLRGSQDFFVMEHTDGVPTGYFALPRICRDDELDDAVLSAIQHMPQDLLDRVAAANGTTKQQLAEQNPTIPTVVVIRPRGTLQ